MANDAYHAEINFLARLTNPVAMPKTKADWQAWATDHPNGVIFGRVNESPLTAAPQEVFSYMGQEWGLWPAPADPALISRE